MAACPGAVMHTSPASSPRRYKRYLTEETLERNRERSKKYYAQNRAKVLAKLKSNYAKKREAETAAYCEKHRGFFLSYFQVDPLAPTNKDTEPPSSPPHPTTTLNALDLAYILN
ncbi:hypothetical protein SPRG_13017 [Saprolegnia parasitica CBS 223.65]|uniref:Uncharacterized protein n=1 Tax=Saprolegnia parasitica (strain CBS 223.65) TaxID=695850 RepID=A0A067BT77_SAPPC|nr:hypothetical protein SPRG_13017 [Saprolegnia parasitica CBS 223.65]KDO21679.1 hypothetical protein SPRG_13017 [Saprolegnia parasitica CBS 223.65]|eukprot:XP_012207602.1 hypothetical protein SPRG_13017 [Saprolegnia parasitica CBS 223.65]